MMRKLSIKSLGVQDRPREKAISEGIKSLTDAELVSILIGSGSLEENAVLLAQRILNSVEHRLSALAKLEIPQLCDFKGIGPAKAVSIAAAIELGCRMDFQDNRKKIQILSSRDAYNAFIPKMKFLKQEQMWVMYLNQAKHVLSLDQISIGGINMVLVDKRIVFKKALQLDATSIIMAHNHPSGTLKPSVHDRRLTRDVKETGDLLEITLVDHIIITDNGYYSFLDENAAEICL